jgi:hypothetical protein
MRFVYYANDDWVSIQGVHEEDLSIEEAMVWAQLQQVHALRDIAKRLEAVERAVESGLGGVAEAGENKAG